MMRALLLALAACAGAAHAQPIGGGPIGQGAIRAQQQEYAADLLREAGRPVTESAIEDTIRSFGVASQTVDLRALITGIPQVDPLSPRSTLGDLIAAEQRDRLLFGEDEEERPNKLPFGPDETVLIVGEGQSQSGPAPALIGSGLTGGGQIPEPPVRLSDVDVNDDGTLALDFYPDSFTEVGVLAYHDGSVFRAICSAARVNANWVLTAAHCLDLHQGARLGFFQNRIGGPDRYYTEKPPPGGPGRAMTGALTQVLDRVRYPVNDNTAESDIALLYAPRAGAAGVAPVRFASQQARPEFTIAGYGFGRDPASEIGEALRVSWVAANREVSSDDIIAYAWEYDRDRPGGNHCVGDSGGPVYARVQRGLAGEQREIIGVLSRTNCLTPAGDDPPGGRPAILLEKHHGWVRCVLDALDRLSAHRCRAS